MAFLLFSEAHHRLIEVASYYLYRKETMSQEPQESQSKYSRVSNTTKQRFIYEVMVMKRTVKDVRHFLSFSFVSRFMQASHLFHINYSTGKTIIRLYKTQHLKLREPLQQPIDNYPVYYPSSTETKSFNTASWRESRKMEPLTPVSIDNLLNDNYRDVYYEGRKLLYDQRNDHFLGSIKVIPRNCDIFQ